MTHETTDRELLELASKAAGRVFYDAATGVIRWLAKPVLDQDAARWNARYAGKVAGTIDDKGYVRIVLQVDGKKRKIRGHQLAWFIVFGSIPSEIDHINQDKRDNKIENLRSVTRSENQRNGTMKGNNTSGVPGVTWHKACRKWCAQASVAGKHHHIGLFEHKSDAEKAAKEFRASHGFTENHGRAIVRAAAEIGRNMQ